MSNGPKSPVTVRLSSESQTAIDAIATKEQRKPSEIIRRAIDEFIQRRKQVVPVIPQNLNESPDNQSAVIRVCKLLQDLRALTNDELRAVLEELGIKVQRES